MNEILNLPCNEQYASLKRFARQGEFSAISVARTTTNANATATGKSGDFLHRVILTAAVTVADLIIYTGAGVPICTIPSGTVAGAFNEEINVNSVGGGFYVGSHATGVGTVTLIGDFS